MEFEDKKKNKKKMKDNPSSSEESLRDFGKLNHTKEGQPEEREIRSDLIYIVKKRINSGYYKSAPVIEEMVEYFAKVFESPQ